ncbi:YceD family protein [Saccharophagus degradans]|uniref:Large ribosomal RNA subunit accumulation protein YceD n=1 Tax=Saccharophagus degradans (strain 2-40 / ATCC 43961 / DSM 17024) TaxID=203122 RepID=Q21K92_SACD2|nr:YceD family protein [Saccharophagus degradans]ABD80887.1 protein of unknown function DUF177 [Saccharophagus degradans 2-40]
MRLPQYIEPRKLAQKGGSFDGDMLPEDMPRVMEAIASCESVNAKLQFDIEDQRRRTMRGSIQGDLKLVCQRCLQPVDYKLDVEVNLAMVWDEDQAKKLPGYIEPWIVGEDPEDLHAILEEEVLLALPVVAFHDEDCIDASLLSVGEEVKQPEKSENPFLVLAALKSKSDSNQD